jgi:ribonuclease PH
VALYQALLNLVRRGVLPSLPIKGAVAAISVGIVEGEHLLDLCYEEDSRAQVDFNIAMTNRGELVEVQGSAEGGPFSKETMLALLSLAEKGIGYLFEAQREALKGV